MREISLKRPNKRNKRIAIYFIFSIVVVFSIFVFSESIANTFFHFSRPFQNTFWKAGDSLANWIHSVLRRGELMVERDHLLEEKERLVVEIINLRRIKEENLILRQALDQEIQRDFKIIMANVLSLDLLGDIIMIDRGASDGIKERMPVVTENRVAIGRVIEVFHNFSRVMLITHRESAFDVEIQGKDVIGLVNGLGNSRAEITLIPREKNIEIGDSLVTIPLGGIFPPGLFIGLVNQIERDNNDPFQKAEIVPFFSVRRLRTIFVITDANQ